MSKSNQMPAIVSGSNLPAHLQLGKTTGNENVTATDLQIPRLKLLQKISPELEEGHEKYVDGAKAGHFLNTVTNETTPELYVVNMHFDRGYSVFKKREAGGGFFGEFDSENDARAAIEAEGENAAQFDIAENHRHMLAIIDPQTGKIQMPALMDFTNTKIRTSKSWNSDISVRADGKCPRFGLVYKLTASKQSNAKGSWHGVAFEFAGFASEDLYKQAERQYNNMMGVSEEPAEETAE